MYLYNANVTLKWTLRQAPRRFLLRFDLPGQLFSVADRDQGQPFGALGRIQ
jgi:hypothetical protein